MPGHPPFSPRDLYVGCLADVHRWGGATTAATGMCGAARARGWQTLMIGATSRHHDAAIAAPHPAHFNLRISAAPLLWRIQSWRTAGQLARQLARLAPPRKAFVGVSPHWVIAARRAWPNVCVVYLFPCLLANCLPFTWPRRRTPTFWRRVDFAGIVRSEHLAFDLADLTLVPTPQSRAEVLAFHPHVDERLAVCNYGCRPRAITAEMRAAQRRWLGVDEGAFVIFVAGVCDLNKAFAHVVRELPSVDPRTHLVVLGDGPERPALTRLAAELGVAGRLHLPGPQPDPAPWYAAADCVASTSWYDTFPNVVLEGMHHGRPVVVPRHDPPHVFSGTAEIVAETGAGRVYDRRQPGALACAVNRLIANRAAAAALGERGRAAALERFRWERVADHVAALCGEPPMRDEQPRERPQPQCEGVHVG